MTVDHRHGEWGAFGCRFQHGNNEPLESEGYFGSMYSGTSRDDDDFELDEVVGEVGDNLDLLLTLTDDEHVFEVSLQLVLEPHLGKVSVQWM